MATDPAKNDEIWKGTCEKEMLTWLSPDNYLKSLQLPSGTAQEAGPYYRTPVPGDSVVVSGMRRRPELNGSRGEIVSSTPDEFGRVTVRVYDSTIGEARKMLIQPFRLMPNSSSSMSPLDLQDDRSSVRSLSRQGSVVSVASRALGSAISFSAKSALSNTGSGAGRSLRIGTPMPAPSQAGSKR
eukprot:TRINITY_DN94442_c0_g1_i1.p1 TRINITY_DN94442_c0_g1~~TRINITY_DN94442_c0_g1_i1.p1  ORF type:complete len:184 (+),score=22.06 TRINITY_DN94442_c0_g1_i1:74-625(+)